MLKCSDDTIYTGVTTDLPRRINEHNSSPKGAKYTRARRPVELIHSESYGDKSSALKREHQIKQLSKSQKLFLIHNTIDT